MQCIQCSSGTSSKWYTGPRCSNCYIKNWKKGIKQPRSLTPYGENTSCIKCGVVNPKQDHWYSGPTCRECYRVPKLLTGRRSKKRHLGIGTADPGYDTLYRKARRATDPQFRGECNARTKAYQISKRRRTLPNLSAADREKLKQIYRDCPKGLSVDHIIPLNGENVSGLHVPWNLQYLSKSENSRKGNRVA